MVDCILLVVVCGKYAYMCVKYAYIAASIYAAAAAGVWLGVNAVTTVHV